MNELQALVEAYASAAERDEPCALATVVSVEGSAYRRPGARVLLTRGGLMTGSISGGCLERDVALRAAPLMADAPLMKNEPLTQSRAPLLVQYDTRGSEEIVWGLGLGCNGVVRVLLESLREGSAGARALSFIADSLRARRSCVLATVIAFEAGEHEDEDRAALHVGERLLLDQSLNVCGAGFGEASLEERVREEAREILRGGRACVRAYDGVCGGRVEVFFDVVVPPPALVIFGGEQDALPLVRQARILGWRVTVVDTRARAASRERFAEADEVLLCRASEAVASVALTPNTAAVVMTHNYLDDLDLLGKLLPSPVYYLGVLGPKSRTSRLLEEVSAEGLCGLTDSQLARLHSPAGVDIGAETPAEIALSIVCEIEAVRASRGAGFLRDRNAPIHEEFEQPALHPHSSHRSHSTLPAHAPSALAAREVTNAPLAAAPEGGAPLACGLSSSSS